MGLPPLAPEASASAIPPHPHHLEIMSKGVARLSMLFKETLLYSKCLTISTPTVFSGTNW